MTFTHVAAEVSHLHTSAAGHHIVNEQKGPSGISRSPLAPTCEWSRKSESLTCRHP